MVIRAGSLSVMPPVKAAWCCQHVCGFRYADDMRRLLAWTSMRVLIVEDEPYMAEAIRDGLRLEAIAADIAGDGDTALDLLSVNAYDIAVLDRDIPGPTGDVIAERIVASGARDRRPPAGPVPPRGVPRRPLRRADPEAVRGARSARRRRRRSRQRRRPPGASMG